MKKWGYNCDLEDIVYAYYDFLLAPVTFDFTAFLFLAEMFRKDVGCSRLHVVIVPGSEKGFRSNQYENYLKLGANNYGFDIMSWRLKHIVVPVAWLLPSCCSLTLCSSRNEAEALYQWSSKNVFPENYSVEKPVLAPHEVHALQNGTKYRKRVFSSIVPSQQSLTFVDRWIADKVGGRKLVVITLRECDYEMHRNSNVQQWIKFAAGLDESVYCPVFIRDMDKAFLSLCSDLNNFLVFSEAVWNLELRAAFYFRSYLHMAVAGGPVNLSYFNRSSRFLVFYKPSAGGAVSYSYMDSQGLPPGSQYNWFSPLQRLVWDEDNEPVLRRSFDEMCERIENFMHVSDINSIVNKIRVLIEKEDFMNAEWLASLAVERFPEKTEAWLLKSKVLRLAGEPSEALNAVNKAAEINETPQGLDELQAIAKAMGREAEADTIAAYRQRTYS